MPAAAFLPQRVELVEPARAPVGEDRVPVASALDVHAGRDRVGAAVALVGVVEHDPGARRTATDDVERDPNRRALPQAGAEVGVDGEVAADRRHDRRRVGDHGKPVDALVPRVRGGKDGAAGEARRRGRGGGETEDGCEQRKRLHSSTAG